jgi:hypothetical protein
MKLSEIKPIPALSELLVLAGVTETIYSGSKPTTGLPDVFVEILQNGSYKSNASRISVVEGVLLVSINVKLLSSGVINTVMEDLVLNKFEDMFSENKQAVNGDYRFNLDLTNMVYSGRGISEGYSTKVINLKVKIF